MHHFSASLMVLVLLAWIQAGLSQFNEEGRKYVLDRHNLLRSKIALGKYKAMEVDKPAAANMSALVWDASLEKAAQAWAETCPYTNSKNRSNTGENLYWWFSNNNATGNPQLMGSTSAATWEAEFQTIGWPANNLTSEVLKTGIGHATQMAWAWTRTIGCGLARCPVPDTFTGQKWAVVCQYHPAANYLNRDIYESGPACTKCPGGTKCDDATGLCVV